VAEKVLDIVDMTSEGLCLFTNRRSMEKVADMIRDRIEEKGYPFLKQGEAARDVLLREFKEAGNAVLFGLDSFWEGVDVPGDALSCVVLAKLPFPVPDDPVMEAREQLWKAQDWSPSLITRCH
jgi:ATP-dependent DNA helicase DinG